MRARARELEVYRPLHPLQIGVVTDVTDALRMSEEKGANAFRNRT